MSYRILIVDDEETLCEVLKFNLEAEGYEVDTACNAEEVLAMDVSRYDLVLLDIMMGDISGIQLAKIIRLDPATSAIPIIFCTAKDSEDDMVKGLELGADDYITKPYSLRNILARVKTVLRRAKASANTRRLPDESVSFQGLHILPSKKMCLVAGTQYRQGFLARRNSEGYLAR